MEPSITINQHKLHYHTQKTEPISFAENNQRK